VKTIGMPLARAQRSSAVIGDAAKTTATRRLRMRYLQARRSGAGARDPRPTFEQGEFLCVDDSHTRPTVRAMASVMESLVAQTTAPEVDERTIETLPPENVLAEAGGPLVDPLGIMRELYASGDAEGALAVAALLTPAEQGATSANDTVTQLERHTLRK
jgi:hypothetical protein